MFDIGIGELLIIGIIAILVFGPERLPRAAADAGRAVASLRRMAATAKQDLSDAAGVDVADHIQTLRGLNPRSVMLDLMDDVPNPARGVRRASSDIKPDSRPSSP